MVFGAEDNLHCCFLRLVVTVSLQVGGENSRLYTVGDLLRFSVDLHELREGELFLRF